MIYTITLNPTIDHIFQTKSFTTNSLNHYFNNFQTVGGKGINVAIMLKHLDVDVIATGLLGSKNNEIFNKKFKELKLKERFFQFDGHTVINYKIMNVIGAEQTELNAESQVDVLDGVKLLDFLDRNLQQHDLVVASGSVPRALSPMIYYEIGMIAKRNKALFILDSSKVWLKKGLKTKPFLIKPNLNEVCELLNLDKNKEYSLVELKAMIYDLQKFGAQNVLLSLGKRGSVYFEKGSDSFYKISTVDGTLVNSTGAGDSMLAGFIYGLVNKLALKDTLKYAAACGAATVFNQQIGELDGIKKILNQITVRQL